MKSIEKNLNRNKKKEKKYRLKKYQITSSNDSKQSILKKQSIIKVHIENDDNQKDKKGLNDTQKLVYTQFQSHEIGQDSTKTIKEADSIEQNMNSSKFQD